MKSHVLYDSQYGNTERIAQAIGAALSQSGEAQVLHISQATPVSLNGLDLLIVGSPTQRFNPTTTTTEYLKELPSSALHGVKVAAFDTRFTREEIEKIPILAFFVRIFGYAAGSIAKQLETKGGSLQLPAEGFYVDGMEGPLLEGELERARVWAVQLASLGINRTA